MDLNHRPTPYQGVALPLSYTDKYGGDGRDRTDDIMLAKHTLSQLSYTPKY